MKGVARSHEPTESYHLTLRSVLASFSSILWFYGGNFTVLVHCQQLFSAYKSSDKPSVCYLLSTKRQTVKGTELVSLTVNRVEHLAPKETDISLRSWWRPKSELKRELILDLHSSGRQTHDSKFIIVSLCVC